MATPSPILAQPKARRTYRPRTGTLTEQILPLLATYYCLSADDLTSLIYPDPKDTNYVSVCRTLRLLERRGFIRYRTLPTTITIGTPPRIWGLTDKAVPLIGAGKEYKTNLDARLLPHEYAISQFHLKVTALCRAAGWELYWQQIDLKCGINPDAYFSITKDGKHWHFFLEVEKGTGSAYRNGKSGLIRKLENYFAYYDTEKCELEWGFPRFTIIILQKNAVRSGNLANAFPPKIKHAMFWLMTEAEPLTRFNALN